MGKDVRFCNESDNMTIRDSGVRASLDDLSRAVGLGTIPDGAKAVVLQVSQNVRYRDDGIAPTAATGIRLIPDHPYVYAGDLSAIRFIEEAASATLEVAFYADKVTNG